MPIHLLTSVSQDDVMVEIFFNTTTNTAGLAIECDSHVLNGEQAQQIADEWVTNVGKVLG